MLAALLLGGLAGPALAADCVSGTAYTAAAVCTVPAGMNSMTVTVIGGGGGSGFLPAGGNAASGTGTLAVTAGHVLNLAVGGGGVSGA
ncbi:MAG: IPTL-CTERM sorting domain-containing protein, partial [Proteobacteria bacterium]|nr:IPTL-CTERM sorting domain-containing protein [Pseudomonadota bacterium]